MKAELLKSGLTAITQVSNSPILVVVKGNVLTFGGYSDTSTLVMTAPVDDPDIHVVLPLEHAKQLAKVLGKNGLISLDEGQNDSLVVTQGKSKFTYTTLPIDSVSYKLLVHHYKEDFQFTIDGELLAKGISTVLNFSVGDINDVRAKNIHLSIEKDTVEIAASNGSTLAVYKFPVIKGHGKGDLPVTLVGRVLANLGKTMPGNVSVGFSPKKMYYKAADMNFTYMGTLPVISHTPFPYRSVIDRLSTAKTAELAIIEKDDFIEKSKAVMYFTEENVKNRVSITFSPTSIVLDGSNEKGSFNLDFTPIACDITAPMKMSLDYLIRVASVIPGSELSFKVIEGKLFVSDDKFTCVIPQLKS